jgi:subtilisin family serine protease
MDLESQLKAFGHAQVVVVLKPKKTKRVGSRTALAVSETTALQEEAASTLKPLFRRFADSRTQILAKETKRAAARRGGRESMGVAPARSTPPPPSRYFPNLGVMLGTVDRKGLKALNSHKKEVAAVMEAPEFSLISPHEVAALAGQPAGISWGITRLGVTALWEKGLTGKGILIGHLDTGVDVTHPALMQSVDVFAEFDLIGEEVTAGGASATARDTGSHGTHTAGILNGQPHDGLTFGVAPGAKLASAIVIEGGDVPARTIAALDWTIGQGCRVVNLSLGVRGFHAQFATILRLVKERDVLPIVAVGNEGAQTSRSPGNHQEVISVGAIDEQDAVWLFSSSQILPTTPKRSVPDLAAPGVAIWSSAPNGKLIPLSGTSMATPHVSGLAALLMEHKPDASAADVEKAIYKSCTRPAGASTVRVNRGVPAAVKALAALDAQA